MGGWYRVFDVPCANVSNSPSVFCVRCQTHAAYCPSCHAFFGSDALTWNAFGPPPGQPKRSWEDCSDMDPGWPNERVYPDCRAVLRCPSCGSEMQDHESVDYPSKHGIPTRLLALGIVLNYGSDDAADDLYVGIKQQCPCELIGEKYQEECDHVAGEHWGAWESALRNALGDDETATPEAKALLATFGLLGDDLSPDDFRTIGRAAADIAAGCQDAAVAKKYLALAREAQETAEHVEYH
jgi:hypothetical protein